MAVSRVSYLVLLLLAVCKCDWPSMIYNRLTPAPFEYVAPLYLLRRLASASAARALITLDVDNAIDGKCLFGDVETDFNGLECAVPSIQGVVDLRVKTNGDVSNALSFEVLEAVRMVSVLPNTGPTNGNTEVVIRARDLRGTTPWSVCSDGTAPRFSECHRFR